jgi:hypothetical protein
MILGEPLNSALSPPRLGINDAPPEDLRYTYSETLEANQHRVHYNLPLHSIQLFQGHHT